jgi:hypothetical protein
VKRKKAIPIKQHVAQSMPDATDSLNATFDATRTHTKEDDASSDESSIFEREAVPKGSQSIIPQNPQSHALDGNEENQQHADEDHSDRYGDDDFEDDDANGMHVDQQHDTGTMESVPHTQLLHEEDHSLVSTTGFQEARTDVHPLEGTNLPESAALGETFSSKAPLKSNKRDGETTSGHTRSQQPPQPPLEPSLAASRTLAPPFRPKAGGMYVSSNNFFSSA